MSSQICVSGGSNSSSSRLLTKINVLFVIRVLSLLKYIPLMVLLRGRLVGTVRRHFLNYIKVIAYLQFLNAFTVTVAGTLQ